MNSLARFTLVILLSTLGVHAASAQHLDFREVFENHSAVMLLIDPLSGAIVDANPAAAQFYGYPPETLRSLSINDINTLAPEQIAAERALAKHEQRNYFIFRHRLANGEIRSVEVFSHPFEFDEHSLLLSIIHDISVDRNIDHALWHFKDRLEELVEQRTLEAQAKDRVVVGVLAAATALLLLVAIVLAITIRRRRHAEAALEARSRELEAALASLEEAEHIADLGHWTIELDSGALEWSPQTRRMYGVNADDEITFDVFKEIVHPADRALVLSSWQTAVAVGGYYEIDHRIVVDGEMRWVRERADAARIREGKIVGTVLDITDRKLAEIEVYRNQQLLRSAIEAIDEAFVIFDEQDQLVWCNEKYRETYPSIADVIQPGVRFEDILRAWVNRGASEFAGKEIEPEAWIAQRLEQRRSGQRLIQRGENGRWLRIVERTTANGHTVGFRIDITELVEARNAAEAANVAKSRFLAMMSHEIRTPLNGILSMAQLMLSAEALPEREYKEYARTIFNSGQALLRLLNDLLDLSRIEADGLALENGIVAPADLLPEVRSLFSSMARDKTLVLSTAWQGPIDQNYRGDPARVRQMLINLVSNAIKFTDDGEVRIEAKPISGQAGRGGLEFSVTDTGIGVPADKIDYLYRPFTQLDDSSSRKFSGSGLGLSIVHKLATAMGGETGVESQIGKGARFWFRLPLQPLAHTVTTLGTTVAPPGAQAQSGQQDDHPSAADANPPDHDAIRAHIAALMPLLDQAKFAALEQFAELEQLVADTTLAPAVAQLRPGLEAFRFSETKTGLSRILSDMTERTQNSGDSPGDRA